jgi:hypothetical protein
MQCYICLKSWGELCFLSRSGRPAHKVCLEMVGSEPKPCTECGRFNAEFVDSVLLATNQDYAEFEEKAEALCCFCHTKWFEHLELNVKYPSRGPGNKIKGFQSSPVDIIRMNQIREMAAKLEEDATEVSIR